MQTYGSLHPMSSARSASSREPAADRSPHSAGVALPAEYHFAVGPTRGLRASRGAELWSLRSFPEVRAHGCCCMSRDTCSRHASRAERAPSLRAGMAPAQDGGCDVAMGASEPDPRHGSDRFGTPKQAEIWPCGSVNMSRHGGARRRREVGALLLSEVAGNAVPGNANRMSRSSAAVLRVVDRGPRGDQ
jgi:hypothetical protein